MRNITDIRPDRTGAVYVVHEVSSEGHVTTTTYPQVGWAVITFTDNDGDPRGLTRVEPAVLSRSRLTGVEFLEVTTPHDIEFDRRDALKQGDVFGVTWRGGWCEPGEEFPLLESGRKSLADEARRWYLANEIGWAGQALYATDQAFFEQATERLRESLSGNPPEDAELPSWWPSSVDAFIALVRASRHELSSVGFRATRTDAGIEVQELKR